MSLVRWVRRELGPVTAGVVGLLVVWTLVSAATSTDTLPSPVEVWRAFVHGVANGTIGTAAAKTLIWLAFSFAVAIALGTAIGFALALNGFARRSIRPLIVALQIAPPIAWFPLAGAWFGFGERAVVFVAIVGSFPSVALATMASFQQVSPLLVRAGRTLGADGWELYRGVMFPAALPGYLAGLDQAWGFAWEALLAGELLAPAARAAGLGQLLARTPVDVPVLLAALAVVVLIGVAVEYLVFGRLDRSIRSRRGLLVEA